MDLYLFEVFAEEAEALRLYIGKDISYEMTSATIQESGLANPPARLISIRTQSIIPAAWAEKLDGILSRSTGYDHLRLFRQEMGETLPCGYLEEYATRAVAEHAVVLLLMLLKKLPTQFMQMQTFQRDGLTGAEWQGKRLLIIGVGRIGNEIAQIATQLGMEVRGVDIVRRHAHINYVNRDEGLVWADAIFCSMDLRDDNRGYFSYEVLRLAKTGAIFVNIARGEHAPTDVLLRLLDEGHLGGVGMDVFENEAAIARALRSGGSEHPDAVLMSRLFRNPRTILTPHNAFNTTESVQRKAEATAKQVVKFMQDNCFDPQLA